MNVCVILEVLITFKYLGCVDLCIVVSCSDDGFVATRSGRIYLVSCKVGFVVSANVAPNDPPTLMRWLRGKPVHRPK